MIRGTISPLHTRPAAISYTYYPIKCTDVLSTYTYIFKIKVILIRPGFIHDILCIVATTIWLNFFIFFT